MTFHSSRLELRPYLPGHLLALFEGTEAFEQRSGLRVAEGFRDLFVSGEVSPAWIAALREASEANPWIHGFAVLHSTRQQ